MSSPGTAIDPLFWPLLIFATTMAIFVLGFVVTVVVLTRRSPGHHPQVSGHQGVNSHDASSHTTIQVRDVNLRARDDGA